MHKKNGMKCWKKKIAKVAPIYVLSTVFLVGVANTTAFASEKNISQNSQQQLVSKDMLPKIKNKKNQHSTSPKNTDDLIHIGDDLNKRISDAVKNRPDLFFYYDNDSRHGKLISDWKGTWFYDDNIMPNLKYPGVTVDTSSGGHIGTAWSYVDDAMIDIPGEVTNIKGLHSFTLGDFHNKEDIEQSYTTASQSYTTTDRLAYSNTKGWKFSGSVNFKIPLTKAGAGVTLSSEYSFNNSQSQETTNSHTITFPSQTIKIKPHGRTIFTGEVKQVEFKGTSDAPVKLSKNDLYVATYGWGHAQTGAIYAAPGQEDHFMYNVFKYSGQPIPNGVHLDDKRGAVIVNDQTEPISFTGAAGFAEEATWEFIPDDPQKPSVTIPNNVYLKEQASGNISKYIDELIQTKMKSMHQ
ncbi:ETX/MTX2 family pore-forming toxin [Bacillus cereus]|uniref:ETX/MTX2 family pore-forming toxin n=1 Tax=Bacillus cereus TaxID=1396 RepID=UPI00397F85FF